ncbi:MAG: glycosyltransferase [Alphaproteobacteria bacterium]|nr:glycosyltransferase [Alphaproteobacteria bacterium]
MTQPKVSVLMPIYKTPEKYLREAIESILTQTFTDFEFLILDDCPEDNRKSIVQSYRDDRIKYFQNESNLGISRSRNKLIDLSKGTYLAVMDHDDISMPTRFEKEVLYLDNNPDIGVVSSNIKDIVKNNISHRPADDHAIKVTLMGGCTVMHPASMIRKSVLTQNNLHYEEEFSPAEDYALWCRLIGVTKFHHLQEILFKYRNHKQNTTHKQSGKSNVAASNLRNFLKETYPNLYAEYEYSLMHTRHIKLFGLIPFITQTTKNDCTQIYLFGIKILRIKRIITSKLYM